MEKEIKYKIIPKLKLQIEIAVGRCTTDDFLMLKMLEIKDPLYNKNYNFLVDLRNLEFEYSSVELQTFLQFLHTQDDVIGKRKSAFLTTTPQQIALITMYSKKTNDLPMNFRVFTTIKEALRFIEIHDEKNPEIIEFLERSQTV